MITYDVSVSDKAGRTRLRKVAKTCQNYGQRVQNSVFECIVDNMQLTELKIKFEDAKNEHARKINKDNFLFHS